MGDEGSVVCDWVCEIVWTLWLQGIINLKDPEVLRMRTYSMTGRREEQAVQEEADQYTTSHESCPPSCHAPFAYL